MNKCLASVIVLSLIALAGVGLLVPLSDHEGHAMQCPFAMGEMVVCAAPIAHLKHWQDALIAIFVECLVLIGAALAILGLRALIARPDPHHQRLKHRALRPIRPPLLQELYSQGILNRKELWV